LLQSFAFFFQLHILCL
jgi:hypothetical protein